MEGEQMSRYNPARKYDRQHQANTDRTTTLNLIKATWAELIDRTGPLTAQQADHAHHLIAREVDYNPAYSATTIARAVAAVLKPESTTK